MPTYEITSPSGRTFQITAPEGATQEQVLAFAQKYTPKSAKEQIENDAISKGAREFAGQGSDALGGLSQGALNVLAGAVRGAGSIGATLARPFESAKENEERRAGIDANARSVGAQTDSLAYKGGKLGAEIAGTMGVGGAIAAPLKAVSGLSSAAGAGAIPALDTAATAIASGGFRTGAALGPVANIATRAGAGALTGGVSAGMVDPGDALTGAVIGGAIPLAAQAVGKGVQKVGNALTAGGVKPEVAKLAQRAEQLGIDIPADRLVDSRPLNAVASSLNYVPFSGRAVTEDIMNSQLNRAVSRTFGQDSSNVTAALRKADDVLGQKFEHTLSKNGVNFDPQFMTDISAIHAKADAELSSDLLKPIQAKINEILQKVGPNGEIEGQAAYNIKKELDRLGRSNTPSAFHALELKGALMDALNRSLGTQQAAEFAMVRKQYGNMLALEKLAPNGAEGELSAARLANMRNINNPELQELADIAAQFIKPREGAHGAAQRVFGAAGVGGIGAVVGGGLPGASVGLGGAALVGRAANAALNSNAAKNAILGAGQAAAPAGALTQTVRQALPVAGAAALGVTQGVEPVQEKPADAGIPISQAEPVPAPTVADIGQAQNVDDAIAAAASVVDHASSAASESHADLQERIAASADAAAEAQQSLIPTIAQAPTFEGEPADIWVGRRGAGYITASDAAVALPSRQKVQPDLDWRIEELQNGRFRLAGYAKPAQEQAEPSPYRLNDTGTLSLLGDSGQLRATLAQMGIQSIPTRDGVLVGKGQAQDVMTILQRFEQDHGSVA